MFKNYSWEISEIGIGGLIIIGVAIISCLSIIMATLLKNKRKDGR